MARNDAQKVTALTAYSNAGEEIWRWGEGGGEDIGYHLIEGYQIGLEKGVSGGMMRRMGGAPAPGSPIRGGTMTFEVADCDERYEWALSNGGAEALPPQDYPGIGRCAYVEDGQGNVVGLIKPEGDA